MTIKKYKKLLMGFGVERNRASKMAEHLGTMRRCYLRFDAAHKPSSFYPTPSAVQLEAKFTKDGIFGTERKRKQFMAYVRKLSENTILSKEEE